MPTRANFAAYIPFGRETMNKKIAVIAVLLALSACSESGPEASKPLPVTPQATALPFPAEPAAVAAQPAMAPSAPIDVKEQQALALLAKGDYDTPVAMFDEILKADPKRGQSLQAVGILFTTRNLYKEAARYFTEAAKYNSVNPIKSLKDLGFSEALQGKFDLAICTMKQTAELTRIGTAERKNALMDLALVYAAAGQVEDALAIAGSYYSSAQPNNNFGTYAKVAQDRKLAQAYLSTSIIAGNAHYHDGWSN